MLPDVNDLTLAEQVAQMVVVRASGFLFDHQIQYPTWEPPTATLRHWVEDLGVGGVILLGASAGELSIRTQQLQNWAKIPLLIAADIEEGVGQRFSGATWFPPPMALSTIFRKNRQLGLQYAELLGKITAAEALAIGINWVLAPVVDVNNNPDNPVINVRAFGETTDEVSQLTGAFIRGAKTHPVLTTAKHFPGHGDTSVDSHLDLPVLSHLVTRLEEVELPPFTNAIAQGVDAVMTAHLLIPAWDTYKPATLSRTILTEQLRQNLGFTGLITTDALVMGAITNHFGANAAPVMAVEAGADILMMPVDPPGAIHAICQAVENGQISRSRILESVERIWQAKSQITSLPRNVTNLVSQVASDEAGTTIAEILQSSQITHGSLPLTLGTPILDTKVNRPSTPCFRNLIVVDDMLMCDFLDHHSAAITLPTKMGYRTQIIDSQILTNMTIEMDCPTLLQVFVRGNPFRGSAGLTEKIQALFKKLLTSDDIQALLVYGSPYVWQQFIPLLSKDVPSIFSYGQMPAAQDRALHTLFGL